METPRPSVPKLWGSRHHPQIDAYASGCPFYLLVLILADIPAVVFDSRGHRT